MNERIRQLRKALSLTLEEFGGRLGVTKTAISRIELGGRNVTDQMAISICREFGVNEEWLRTGSGEMFRQDDTTIMAQLVTKYGLDDLDQAIIESYLQLPAAQRSVIKAYVASISAKIPQASAPCVPGAPSTPAEIASATDEYKRELEIQAKGEDVSSLISG